MSEVWNTPGPVTLRIFIRGGGPSFLVVKNMTLFKAVESCSKDGVFESLTRYWPGHMIQKIDNVTEEK